MQDVDYRAFVEFNPDWVWELDAQGIYRYSNPSVAHLLGYSPEEVVGCSVRDFIVEDAQSRELFSSHSLASGLSLMSYRSSFQHKNGYEVVLESVFLPFKDAQGCVLGYRGCHRDISRRIDLERQLAEAEKLVGMGIWELDLATHQQKWSDGIYRMFGLPVKSVAPSLSVFMDHLPEEDQVQVATTMQQALTNKMPYDIYPKILCTDGSLRNLHARANIIYHADQPIKMLGSVVDVTEQLQLRKQAEQAIHVLNGVIDNVNNLIFYKNRDYVYMGCNQAFEKFIGRTREQIVGYTDFDFFPPEIAQHFRDLDAKIFDFNHRVVNPQWVKYPDGSDVFLHTITTPFYDQNGEVIGLVGNAVDLTTEKRLSDQLEQQALYDGLTEVANRTLFMRDLATLVAQSERHQSRFALLFIDLDGFKPVNDRFGHQYGDMVLKQVAQRIKQSIRKTDLVARLGGDEFAVLLADIQLPEEAEQLAQKLLESARSSVQFQGEEIQVSASIGVAVFPDDGQDSDRLLKLADDAMYVAKRKGKNAFYRLRG